MIATVLLVGFAVALAAIVSTYIIKQAKSFDPGAFLEDSPFCEDMALEPLVVDGVVGSTAPNIWPKATVGVPISTADCTRGGTPPACFIQGIGFKNKGKFSLVAARIKAPGISQKDYFPPLASGGVTTLAPGALWGVIFPPPPAPPPTTTATTVSHSPIEYNPNIADVTLDNRKISVTPIVNDPTQAEKLKKTVQLVACSKQEESFDLKDLCPRCICNCPGNRCGSCV